MIGMALDESVVSHHVVEQLVVEKKTQVVDVAREKSPVVEEETE